MTHNGQNEDRQRENEKKKNITEGRNVEHLGDTHRGVFGGRNTRSKKKKQQRKGRVGGDKYTEVIVLVTVEMWLLW